MDLFCIVRDCTSKIEVGNSITFYRFPTKLQQKEQWLKALRKRSLESPNSCICSKHFEEKYFLTHNGNKILLPGAVPTIFHHQTYSKNTTKHLIPIQPKPSQFFFTSNPGTSSTLLPINIVLVDPLQTNNDVAISNTNNLQSILNINSNPINTSSILQFSANQSNANLPTQFSFVPNVNQTTNGINDQNDIIYPIQNKPIQNKVSAPVIEINNTDEEIFNSPESEDTFSVISLDESDTEIQGSQMMNEACYVLVEVNDNKSEGNLNNTEDDANIIASGFDIKELINEARTAMNDKTKVEPIKIEPLTKRKVWRPSYIGDCVFEDMEDPVVRKHNWSIAINTIKKLRMTKRNLEQKNRRLQTKLSKAKTVIAELNKRKDKEIPLESDDSS